jgi:hypothetical protein
MVVEVPAQCFFQDTDLVRIDPRAICAKALGSRCPLISASIIWRPETPKMSLITDASLT